METSLEQKVALRRSRLRDVRPGDRWLVVVAHPDDETFGCGSLIAHGAAGGAAITVACATRGEAGHAIEAIGPGLDLGAVREAELHRAANVLGAERVELLGYRDSGFDGPVAPGSLCAAAIDEVTRVLIRLVHDVAPNMVVMLDGSDGHRDHLRIREAVIRAVRCVGDTDIELYEHCLPNSLMRRWLDEMCATSSDSAYHSIDPAALGRADADITDVLDVSHLIELREAAIALHRSQASPFSRLSIELKRDFLCRDHVARVRFESDWGMPS